VKIERRAIMVNRMLEKERILLETRYRERISEELEIGNYLKYKSNKDVPFLNIYPYEEAFSFTLVSDLLDRFEANKNDYVLDPFCGLGTTLFTATVRTIPSVGVDRLPFAWIMAKTLPTFLLLKRGETKSVWKELLSSIGTCAPAPVADVPIMRVAFQENILSKLRKMKTAIDRLPEFYKNIFLALFFSILEECSLTVKVNRYPKVIAGKRGSNPTNVMNKKVEMVEKSVAENKFPPIDTDDMPDVFLGDTKNLSLPFRRPPTLMITSPPYADKIDYAQSYILELCFYFVRNYEDYKKLQQQLLRSHTHSRLHKGEKPSHPAVEEIVNVLRNCVTSPVIDMITAYFLDMETVIEEWYHTLSTRARAALVVDNLFHENVMIPVDLILSDIAAETGFIIEKVIVARYRKKSNIPIRQSILLWRK
jgi:hypothetical protein